MIKHIIFDWGGVIEQSSSMHAAKALAKKYNLDVNELFDAFDVGEEGFSTGEDETPYFRKLEDKFGISTKELQFEFNHLHFRARMRQLLTALNEKYTLHILSNQMTYRSDFIKENKDTHFFTGIFFSSEIGYAKPSKEAYLYVLDKIGAQPEECVFTDDLQINIDVANNLGIQGILFTNINKFIKELQERKIIEE